jgi:hypothetical protein
MLISIRSFLGLIVFRHTWNQRDSVLAAELGRLEDISLDSGVGCVNWSMSMSTRLYGVATYIEQLSTGSWSIGFERFAAEPARHSR